MKKPKFVFTKKTQKRFENFNRWSVLFKPGNAIGFPKTPKQTLFYLGKSRSIFAPETSWFINMNFGTIFSDTNFSEMIREKKRKA